MLSKRRQMWILIVSILVLMGLCSGPIGAVDSAQKTGIIGIAPSKQEIIERYRELNIGLGDGRVTFAKTPVLSAPYSAGQVARSELEEALALLNFMRFTAGVPDDVVLNERYTQQAQHAAALMASNNALSHTQSRPRGMSQSFFTVGSSGVEECNLGRGYVDLPASLLVYLQDTDYINIFNLAHRRWLLNPAMQATGFGYAGVYSTTYACDQTRTEKAEFDYIAWPSANTPVELCKPRNGNYAFSLVLGSAYEPAKLEKLSVTLTSGGQEWTLTSADSSLDSFNNRNRYLGVSTETCGPGNCIIFSVGSFQKGDQVDVTINGLVKDGTETSLSYRVDFFSLNE